MAQAAGETPVPARLAGLPCGAWFRLWLRLWLPAMRPTTPRRWCTAAFYRASLPSLPKHSRCMGLKSGLFAGQGSRRAPGARALASTMHGRASRVDPGSILLQHPRPPAKEHLPVSLESRQHYMLISSSRHARIQTPIFSEEIAVLEAATRHQHLFSQAKDSAAHGNVQRGGSALRDGYS